jgi:hypothetical protein
MSITSNYYINMSHCDNRQHIYYDLVTSHHDKQQSHQDDGRQTMDDNNNNNNNGHDDNDDGQLFGSNSSNSRGSRPTRLEPQIQYVFFLNYYCPLLTFIYKVHYNDDER